uniref:HERC4 n=1 Tax=Pavo cristatus TaxID=9049 RepID=A0A8C9FR88_PAVCR
MLCWGNASFGQLGLGGIDEEIVLEPRKSDFFLNKRIRDVGCGLRHTVFVLDDGTVYTCGCNDLGQLGHEKARKRPGKFRGNELQSIPMFECVFSFCDATSSLRLSVLVCAELYAQQFFQDWSYL